jgi:hypothetical protein
MPNYRTLQRLESRVDGRKQVIPAGSALELSEAEAQQLGAAVERIVEQTDTPDSASNPDANAPGSRKTGKKTDSDAE